MDEEPIEVLRKWMEQGQSAVDNVLKDRRLRLEIAAQERDSLEAYLAETQEELAHLREDAQARSNSQTRQLAELGEENERLRQQLSASRADAREARQQHENASLQLKRLTAERDDAQEAVAMKENGADVLLAALQRSLQSEAALKQEAAAVADKFRERVNVLTDALSAERKRTTEAEAALQFRERVKLLTGALSAERKRTTEAEAALQNRPASLAGIAKSPGNLIWRRRVVKDEPVDASVARRARSGPSGSSGGISKNVPRRNLSTSPKNLSESPSSPPVRRPRRARKNISYAYPMKDGSDVQSSL